MPSGVFDVLDGVGLNAVAAIGECCVGRRELNQADFAAAEGEGQPVAFAGLEAVDALLLGLVDQRVDADAFEHLNGRHVVRTGQGGAGADRAVPGHVVVLRDVRLAFGGKEGLTHIGDHGGCS